MSVAATLRSTILLAAAAATALLNGSLPAEARGKDVAKVLLGVAAVAVVAHELSDHRERRVESRDTAVARAFGDLSPLARRSIEERLGAWGYLRGRADGRWDDATYEAVRAFAVDTGRTRNMHDYTGAMFLYEAMVS
ncbi:peptidoglycan-binding protein [Cereibacter sphaeroides]|uniref:peptidoglycan-binding domain-containing protein n=1 Tax=Cereibacter sphaeroides TaxID=1063 RepID=UPI001F365542|nr:peptidoglycan-binding domain-containing protein [Cereibacter sphaeroides]MCE6959216.1 peptidoglycan-binding protein [Cereibacter sphaeroides]MCE6972019.1 peptidoglycan-binding protein [Cereibacter sphaeroides]